MTPHLFHVTACKKGVFFVASLWTLEYGDKGSLKPSFFKAESTQFFAFSRMSGFPDLWLSLWPFSGAFPACPWFCVFFACQGPKLNPENPVLQVWPVRRLSDIMVILTLLVMPSLMQSIISLIPLALFAITAHCSLTWSCLFTRTPRSLSKELLLRQVHPSLCCTPGLWFAKCKILPLSLLNFLKFSVHPINVLWVLNMYFSAFYLWYTSLLDLSKFRGSQLSQGGLLLCLFRDLKEDELV